MNYMKWEELDKYIGEPIWHCKLKMWVILVGYKRYADKIVIVNGGDTLRWEDECYLSRFDANAGIKKNN